MSYHLAGRTMRTVIVGVSVLLSLSCSTSRRGPHQMDPVLQARLDSALRIRLSKGIFVDTSQGVLRQGLPMIVYDENHFRRVTTDSSWALYKWSDLRTPWDDTPPLYSVAIANPRGNVSLSSYYADLSSGRVYDGLLGFEPIVPAVRIEASETPRPEDFPSSAVALRLQHQRAHLVTYVEERLFREGWPSRAHVDRSADSTVVQFITRYLRDSSDALTRRERRVAYMITVADSLKSKCRKVSVRWITQSKGVREATWTMLAADSLHEPRTRAAVVRWFENLEGCVAK